MGANCCDKDKPEEPCVPSADGSTVCTPKCDIRLRAYETNPLTVSGLSGNRLLDNGKDASGNRIYTTETLNYGSISRKFDIKFDKDTKLITAKVRVKVIPLDIHLKDNATGTIETDSAGNPKIVPYYWNKTTDGATTGTGSTYVHVPRTPSLSYLNQLKSKIEGNLNAIPYFLVPDPCCGKLTPCEHKISIKFEVEVDSAMTNPHATVNLFSIEDRADSGNWGEVSTHTLSGPDYPYTVASHEVGHLFGWPDEYFEYGGAVHQMYIDSSNLHVNETMVEPVDDWKRYSNDNLMGGMILKKIEPYYMCHIEKWFEDKTNKSWRVVT